MSAPRARRRRERVAVRSREGGRALTIDGSLASWYRPGSATTGSVWDALAAPLLLLPPRRRRSVLVLGLGGGSAARVARALWPGARLVGVEPDRSVIRAARRWLDLDAIGAEVVVADGLEYLRRGRSRFDAVLEDVFVGRGRRVRKPEWLPAPGLALATRRLAPGGLLVSNTLDESAAVARELARLFATRLRIEIDDYDNRVWVGTARRCGGRALRAAVRAHPVLAASASRLSFRTA